MAIPAGITPITVTGNFFKGDGTPEEGFVVFTPAIAAATAGGIMPVSPVAVALVNGALSTILAATDDADWLNSGFTYTVIEQFRGTGKPYRTYSIEVPAASPGGALNLNTAAHLDLPLTPTESLPTDGGTLTGALEIHDVPGVVSSHDYGYLNSVDLTGLRIASTRPTDDVSGGIDGTGRLILESLQRGNFYSFGEVIRTFLRWADAKGMFAWYFPVAGYNPDRTPDESLGWKPGVWIGAHMESNGHTGNHNHWEIEIPDSTGALQGRFEILMGSQSGDTVGLDTTNILTNLAHFTVRTSNNQEFRLTSNAGNEKPIVFANDTDGVTKRWKIRTTSEAESTGAAGSNFQIVRYDDSGTLTDIPVIITRSTGLVTIGGTSGSAGGLLVQRNGGNAIAVNPLATGGSAILVTGTDATASALQGLVSGDSSNRFKAFVDGKLEWGSGSATRDVNLYRSAADVLKTDDSLTVTVNLRINTTSTASGAGVIAIANASTLPSGTPSGGGVVYVEAGALKYKGSSGTVTTMAVA
jgi:hypothetical protein